MLSLSQILPVGAPSSPFKCFLTCLTFLYSGTTGCSRLILYFPCPSSVSHFSKVPCFFLFLLVVPFSPLDGDSFIGESSRIYVWAYLHTQACTHMYFYHSNAAKLPSLPPSPLTYRYPSHPSRALDLVPSDTLPCVNTWEALLTSFSLWLLLPGLSSTWTPFTLLRLWHPSMWMPVLLCHT